MKTHLESGMRILEDGERPNPREHRRTITQREVDALQLRDAGLTYAAIAERMGVSAMRAHSLVNNASYKCGRPGAKKPASWAETDARHDRNRRS